MLGVLGCVATLIPNSAPAGRDAGGDYADCWFSPAKHKLTVQVNDEQAEIRRSGGRIAVLSRRGGIPLRVERCKGGKAKVASTEKILFRVHRPIGVSRGRLSLDHGPLAPGRGFEGEGPEIEVKVTQRPPAEFELEGTAGDDLVRGGSLGRAQGLNLNPGLEPLAPDSDVRLIDVARRQLVFDTGGGNDVLDLGGGPEFAGPFSTRFATIVLGEGNDRFVGSTGSDYVAPSPGVDSISTGLGRDVVLSRDGVSEPIDCGPGNDTVIADLADVLIGCEDVETA